MCECDYVTDIYPCTGKSVKGFFSPHVDEVAHLIKTGLLFFMFFFGGVGGGCYYNCVKESPTERFSYVNLLASGIRAEMSC